MPDFVRVEDSRTGAKITVVRDGIEQKFQTELLDDDNKPLPAVDAAGQPLPPEPGDGRGDSDDDSTDADDSVASEPAFVRVKVTATGAHITVPRDGVEDGHEVLEGHAAVDSAGQPLPPKPLTSIAGIEVDDDTSDDVGPDWSKSTVAELEEEIQARNDERAVEDHIVPEEPKNKPQLVAALVADDDAQP